MDKYYLVWNWQGDVEVEDFETEHELTNRIVELMDIFPEQVGFLGDDKFHIIEGIFYGKKLKLNIPRVTITSY